ncbi:carbohydrate ABC transporter permease [Conexibacter woesei]|uniref:Binding-protein-dependent transport systems inner membrane component n=1 Tax=Conexibacter woesei (strain DSM 14684 / CCUG 47730 / CIP 108061 / JCM 11494 / NBRC 100937 / ID131577) TaxID=469383 RepID=D3F602_CONWI|nr:carbohydrate ABC transporter permease [Conexibacter woesei]ADB48675.1 binding-protein-dependent transport systems inner membrane component [Conexibacter woesei DSM 14684]
MTPRRATTIARYVALSLFAIPWVVLPLWMVVVNAFKTQGEAQALSLDLPGEWAIGENFRTVIDDGNYLTGLLNSVLVTVPAIAVVLLLGSAAAWAFARTRSRWLRAAYYLTTLSVLLPPAIIPSIYLLRELSLDGSRLGYALVTISARLGIVIFLTTGFVRALPGELEDAAAVDGASAFQTYRRILLPLMKPVLLVGGVILMITVWNDFFFALFLIQGEGSATLPLTLYGFASSTVDTLRWNLVFAHVVLTSLPLVVVYLFVQRRVLSGLTEGAVKG